MPSDYSLLEILHETYTPQSSAFSTQCWMLALASAHGNAINGTVLATARLPGNYAP